MRQEYVLNESGRVYTNGLMFYPWFFGQFEHRILDITLYLLDKSNLSTSAKCNAVAIARALCMGITFGDGEVITGNFTSLRNEFFGIFTGLRGEVREHLPGQSFSLNLSLISGD